MSHTSFGKVKKVSELFGRIVFEIIFQRTFVDVKLITICYKFFVVKFYAMEFKNLSPDIYFNIMLHSRYDDLLNLLLVSQKFYVIGSNKFFWQRKVMNDFAVTEAEYNEIEDFIPGDNPYIVFAGIYDMPIMGAKKYGRLEQIVKTARKNRDIKYITHLLDNLSVDEYVSELGYALGKLGLISEIKKHYKKFAACGLLYNALDGAVIRGKINEVTDLLQLYDDEIYWIAADSIKSGNFELFQLLLNKLNINFLTDEHLIYTAAKKGNIEVIKFLLAKGNKNYSLALYAAYVGNRPHIVDLLTSLDDDIDYDIPQYLIYAAKNGFLETAISKINSKMDNMHSVFNNALVYAATKDDNLPAIKMLISHGANKFFEALVSAVDNNCIKLTKYLLSQPNISDKYATMIEHLKIFSGEFNIIDTIIPISIEIYIMLFEYVKKIDQLKCLKWAAFSNDFKLAQLILDGAPFPLPDDILNSVIMVKNILISKYISYKEKIYLGITNCPNNVL